MVGEYDASKNQESHRLSYNERADEQAELGRMAEGPALETCRDLHLKRVGIVKSSTCPVSTLFGFRRVWKQYLNPYMCLPEIERSTNVGPQPSASSDHLLPE